MRPCLKKQKQPPTKKLKKIKENVCVKDVDMTKSNHVSQTQAESSLNDLLSSFQYLKVKQCRTVIMGNMLYFEEKVSKI